MAMPVVCFSFVSPVHQRKLRRSVKRKGSGFQRGITPVLPQLHAVFSRSLAMVSTHSSLYMEYPLLYCKSIYLCDIDGRRGLWCIALLLWWFSSDCPKFSVRLVWMKSFQSLMSLDFSDKWNELSVSMLYQLRVRNSICDSSVRLLLEMIHWVLGMPLKNTKLSRPHLADQKRAHTGLSMDENCVQADCYHMYGLCSWLCSGCK